MNFKPASACTPGELVLTNMRGPSLAITALDPETNGRHFVLLSGDTSSSSPCYISCNTYNEGVLSYGNDYEIEADLNGPKELRPNRLSETIGALLIHSSGPYLRIRPAKGLHGYGIGCLRLLDGMLATEPNQGGYATFAHWDLKFLSNTGCLAKTILSFKPQQDEH